MKSALMYLGLFILFYLAAIFAIKNRKLFLKYESIGNIE